MQVSSSLCSSIEQEDACKTFRTHVSPKSGDLRLLTSSIRKRSPTCLIHGSRSAVFSLLRVHVQIQALCAARTEKC